VPLSCDLGTLTSWNPLGHSRPVTGLLYLYLYRTLLHSKWLGMIIVEPNSTIQSGIE